MIELVRSRGRGREKRVIAVAIDETRASSCHRIIRLPPRLGGIHESHRYYPFYRVELGPDRNDSRISRWSAGAASLGDFHAPLADDDTDFSQAFQNGDMFLHPWDIPPVVQQEDAAFVDRSFCEFAGGSIVGWPTSLPCMPALASFDGMTILEWLYAQALRVLFEKAGRP